MPECLQSQVSRLSLLDLENELIELVRTKNKNLYHEAPS